MVDNNEYRYKTLTLVERWSCSVEIMAILASSM